MLFCLPIDLVRMNVGWVHGPPPATYGQNRVRATMPALGTAAGTGGKVAALGQAAPAMAPVDTMGCPSRSPGLYV